MKSISVKRILTHENPDLDAILSVLLFKRFGEKNFPGVTTAEISFCPAGKLPDGKSSEELEQEGIFAVDVGGGRFDTHPVSNQVDDTKLERCAADLVAEAVGVLDDLEWTSLIEFTRQHDVTGQSIHSTDYIHHLPTIPTILSGFHILFDGEPNKSERILHEGIRILEIIPVYVQKKSEEDGFDALPLIKEMVDRYLDQKEILQETPPPEFESFLEWRKRLLEDPQTAFSSNPLDEVVSFPALITGLWYIEDQDKEQLWKRVELFFDGIIARTTLWVAALQEFDKKGQVYEVRKKAHIVAIESSNGLTIGAARFRHRADLIIYRDPQTEATSFLIKRNGPLNKFSMRNLAAKIRIAECIERKIHPDYSKVMGPGMVHDWFLHQSENLLIRGSKKATDFIPSKISMENLAKIAISEADWDQKMPVRYCPDNKCLRGACFFYTLHAPTCKNHRKRLYQTETPSKPDQKSRRKKHQQAKPIGSLGKALLKAREEIKSKGKA